MRVSLRRSRSHAHPALDRMIGDMCEEAAGGWRSYTRTANQHCGPDNFAPDLHGLRGGPAGGSVSILMQSRVAELARKLQRCAAAKGSSYGQVVGGLRRRYGHCHVVCAALFGYASA
jgi:hypothetical protein